MGRSKMGRYWSSKEGWQISTLWKKIINRFKKRIPEVRPTAKATRMTKGEKASAVKRKRAAGNPGGKPTNVATFTKRKKMGIGGIV